MTCKKLVTRLFSCLFSLAALGLFWSGEAFAGLCYKEGTTTCKSFFGTSSDSVCVSKFGTGWKSYTGSCSASGQILTFNGSTISCTQPEPVGSITARRGNAAAGQPAVWSEFGDNVVCNKDGADPGTFDLFVEYKFSGGCIDDPNAGLGQCKFSDPQNPGKKGGSTSTTVSQAVCTLASKPTASGLDELAYKAFCGPAVTVTGYLKYVGALGETRPGWVGQMCTDSAGNPADCINTPNGFLMVLGGFQTDRKGNVDPTKCLTDFTQLTDPVTGQVVLPAGKVLDYVEYYPANTGCGLNGEPRINAADAKRRMCQDHTFFNPNFSDVTVTGTATNPPCAPTKTTSGTVTFTGGISAGDRTDGAAAVLYENQWKPDSTLNISCQNSGTNPTTVLNSENFAASSFPWNAVGSSIVAYVKESDGTDKSPFTSANVIFDATTGAPTGLKIHFADCNGGNGGNGLDQVICRNINYSANPPTVNLTIRADREDGLGFIGDALDIKLNQAAANCPAIVGP